MIKGVILLVTVLALSLSTPALAAEPGNGTVEGRLVNGTENGSSVADQEITLKTYLNDAEVGTTTTTTDAEGRFVFNDLLTEPGYVYEVGLFYQQAEYWTDWLSFDEGETSITTELTVYDSTTSDEAIKVATAHTIIYTGQGSLQVMEYYLFVNETDRTYIGSKEINDEGTKETLRFSLPSGVTELQPAAGLMQCCIFSSEDGFIDTMAVLPGMKEISYTYIVDSTSGTFTLPQKVNYPILNFDLLVQGEGIQVSADRLVTQEPLNIEGVEFTHLVGSNLAPDDTLLIQLSGLTGAENQNALLWVILSLAVLGAAFGVGYSMRKKRVQPVPSGDNFEQQQQKLLVELAQLDDDFEDGKIAEDSYRSRRNEVKTQLLTLIQGTKGGKGNS